MWSDFLMEISIHFTFNKLKNIIYPLFIAAISLTIISCDKEDNDMTDSVEETGNLDTSTNNNTPAGP